MSYHDLQSNNRFESSIKAKAITSTETGTGVDVGNPGASGLEALIACGIITDGTHTIAVQKSIDGGGTWTAMTNAAPSAGGELLAALPVLTSTTVAGSVFRMGIAPQLPVATTQMQIRIVNTVSGLATVGGLIAGLIHKGGALKGPFANP